jgi:hypothetical protein
MPMHSYSLRHKNREQHTPNLLPASSSAFLTLGGAGLALQVLVSGQAANVRDTRGGAGKLLAHSALDIAWQLCIVIGRLWQDRSVLRVHMGESRPHLGLETHPSPREQVRLAVGNHKSSMHTARDKQAEGAIGWTFPLAHLRRLHACDGTMKVTAAATLLLSKAAGTHWPLGALALLGSVQSELQPSARPPLPWLQSSVRGQRTDK